MQALGPASAIAFIPGGDRLAVLTATSPGRMTLTLIGPDRQALWEQTLTRERMSNAHPEGVNVAPSPAGHLLACATGTSAVSVFDAATGRQVRQFDDHSQTVTGLSWIDDESLLSASMDATLRVWRPDDPVSATVVETIAAAGLAFVRERRTALIWSARGELLAWSLAETPAQLWDRNPPARNVAAYFTRPAHQCRDRPAGAGGRRVDRAPPGQPLGPGGQRAARHHHHLRQRQGPAPRRLGGRQVGPGHGLGRRGVRAHRVDPRAPNLAAPGGRPGRRRPGRPPTTAARSCSGTW